MPFRAAARTGKHGFEIVPKMPGIYAVRATKVGSADIAQIKADYLGSEFFRALCGVDTASERFFADLGFGDGWGWKYESYAASRLVRLDRLRFTSGKLTCPLIYIGSTKRLQTRLSQLANWGHTANHPFWALLLAGWEIEVGFRLSGTHAADEEQLKRFHRGSHQDSLPALVDK